MIESGELARMVDRGLACAASPRTRRSSRRRSSGPPTTTPTSPEGAREGLSAREIYRRLAVRDVQLAADVLRGVYDESDGADGYVSLEVAPRLAHDTEGTLEQARMYWGLVDRPNLMIKIPATPEGIPAIETALYEGMNVNVTLLFGVAAYEEVMRAFIRAMERRHAEGLPLDRHSVASFFVSRVDTEVDKRLAALGDTDLQGRAGLANARSRLPGVQARLRRRASSPRCARPAARSSARCGRRPASRTRPTPRRCTSTGSSAPTRSTRCRCRRCRPPRARARSTGATADRGPDAPDLRRAAPRPAIDLDDVTDQLLREGIDAFVVPMNKLLAGVEAKREAIVTGRPGVVRGRPAARARAAGRRAPAQGRARRTSCAGSGAATARCGRRRARPSWRTGSAG